MPMRKRNGGPGPSEPPSRQNHNQGWAALTATERQIVALACKGLSNPQIAQRLHISRRTVSTHLYRIFKKVQVTSRAELAAEAVRRQFDVGVDPS